MIYNKYSHFITHLRVLGFYQLGEVLYAYMDIGEV